ncbi:hypothetical protein Q4491_04695 [Photobacterium sp. 2_MG-2023]|uniref:hypothetical protein n=1 Tax=Photobacterium sp. 2_MG-2023 TaxID=3062663 RepID=UPI0026E47B99|nr:hypothetical protein [Photobacterium sp. 2_MG-2023]MDO6580637.1 hypothetical protein [Photobacterium sp. 2_MG-2023]
MKIISSLLIAIFSVSVFAGKDISRSQVDYVYQLDSDSTVFEFNSTVPHDCGGALYRVKSPNEAIANWKFSIVLTAFTADKNLAFYNTETCEDNRAIVGWVKVTK